jgi:molybdopterin-guanine dinucleotide biosynthesis protein
MLTYRTGAAGAPSAARFMSEHLLQQTLPPEMAAMAEYYEQGMTPPTIAEATAGRYARLAADGEFLSAETLDSLLKVEVARLAESALHADGTALGGDELAMRALAAFAGAGLIQRDTALACMVRLTVEGNAARLEAAIENAITARDYSSATATPRRDMNPALAARLGINPSRGLKQQEVAFLLNGQRADGEDIPEKKKQSATLPMAEIFGLPRGLRPTRAQLERVLAGTRADGSPLVKSEADRAMKRFLWAMGHKSDELTPDVRANILAGKMADGSELSDRHYQKILDTSKTRIGYIDLTFSAPKSLSIAWAFAPTKAERAIMHQAHNDAIDSVMKTIEVEIGRARMGIGGKKGFEPGSIGWVSFDHYAARPTVEIIRLDADGVPTTELHTLTGTGGRVPGDMQVHTHVAVFNVVETASGRVGGLDLAQLEGRIHEWGALYQAYLANNLRAHGVEMELDSRNEMARLEAVPESVVVQFSKRTIGGTEAARAYAESQGLDWDSLDQDRKIGLLKSGVQNPREAKTDDVSDLAAWRMVADRIGYQHRSVLRPDAARPILGRDERLEIAYQAAMPLLGKQLDRRAVIDGSDARIAAAKGLIASGVESAEEVNLITHAFRERGIQRRGEDAALVWGLVNGTQGRQRIAITTNLEEREEKALISTALTASRDKSAALKQDKIEAAIAAFPEIDFQIEHGRAQRAIIDKLGTGGRIGLAIGVAGSGKSTLLKPLVRAWQDDGRIVHGIALAWRQSGDLADAGIDKSNTRAVASFLRGVESGRVQLNRKSVVVVDELGLLGTRQLNDILAVQKKTGFQLVMIGDPKQMQAVEAGPVIELLRRALGPENVPELGSSVRQKEVEERETALMFRNGQTEEAILRKDASGTLRIAPGGYREAIAQVADLWQQRYQANRERPDFTITVSAPTNAEAHDISVAIRRRRCQLGEIGPDKVTLAATDGEGQRSYDLTLAEGDRVRLFRRINATFMETGATSNIGQNGTVLEIAGIQDNGLMMKTNAGKQGFVPWERLRDESGRLQLAYGDALTTNTAQGSTVTEHIHAMPSGARLVTAFGAYTSGSRHREQSFIVTSEGAERAEIIGKRPLGDRREITRYDILQNLTKNLARQPEKESSLHMIERAAILRRGNIQHLHKAVQSFEARASARKKPEFLVERLKQNKILHALETQLPGLAERLHRHIASMAQFVRAGSALKERIVAVRRQRAHLGDDVDAYWQRVAAKAETPRAQSEGQKQKLRHRPRM